MHGTESRRFHGALRSGACVLALLCVASGVAMAAPHGAQQRIAGEVMVQERDRSGAIRSVGIYDDTWGLVFVELKGKGRELIGKVGDTVEATGAIEPAENGRFVIRVAKFRVLESGKELSGQQSMKSEEVDRQ